jgi:hypothetical protein
MCLFEKMQLLSDLVWYIVLFFIFSKYKKIPKCKIFFVLQPFSLDNCDQSRVRWLDAPIRQWPAAVGPRWRLEHCKASHSQRHHAHCPRNWMLWRLLEWSRTYPGKCQWYPGRDEQRQGHWQLLALQQHTPKRLDYCEYSNKRVKKVKWWKI